MIVQQREHCLGFEWHAAYGSHLGSAECLKQRDSGGRCYAAFLAFHLTASSTAYLEVRAQGIFPTLPGVVDGFVIGTLGVVGRPRP